MMSFAMLYILFFFFKQKTAYEMRISDWSSDVCSSDLIDARRQAQAQPFLRQQTPHPEQPLLIGNAELGIYRRALQIGGDAPLPDSLGSRRPFRLHLAMGLIIIERRAQRTAHGDGDILIMRIQPQAAAPQRPAGPRRHRRRGVWGKSG